MKNKKILITAIAICFLFLIVDTPKVRAVAPAWTLYVLIPNAVESNQITSNEEVTIYILNRDVVFVYNCFLNDTTIGEPLIDGWGFSFPVSKYVNILDQSVKGMDFVGTFTPYLVIYNDTNGDGVLTTETNATINSTEAVYTVFPYMYESVIFSNLTPKQKLKFPVSKPNSYTWGFAFKNVTCMVRNATLISDNGKYDGTIIANDSFAWINKTFTYRYDTDNKRFQLNYTIKFGQFDNETTHLNRSLATCHYHISGKVSSDVTPILKDNNTNEYNTTHSIETSYLDFSITNATTGTLGRFDMIETKEGYKCNGTEYNATSCTTPLTEFNISSINVTQQHYFDCAVNINITGTIGKSYICYEQWNGSVLETDPFQYLSAPTTIYPLWSILIPDYFDAITLQEQNTILLILIILLIASCILIIGFSGGKKAKTKLHKRKVKKKKQASAANMRVAKKAIKKEREKMASAANAKGAKKTRKKQKKQ